MPSSTPNEPLSLSDFPTTLDAVKRSNAPRGLEIALTEETKISKLVEDIQNGGTAQVSLGKKPAIIIDGTKIHPIHSVPRDPCLVYKKPVNSKRLDLHASLSLKDAAAVNKQSELDMNDPAMQALAQGYQNYNSNKAASTTRFVKDSSVLPPAKSGKQAIKGNLAFLKNNNHRRLLSDKPATTRSVPASPSLGGLTPNSARPDMKSVKRDALKTALVHLLAVKPCSKQEIFEQLKCKADEIEPLLEKWQGKMDGSKFTLSDRGYKELDVWRFSYQNQSERQNAIDRAIKAFDRQRISVRENIWQLLLPKEERGKGKVLSKLDLHKGPIERVRTPQIHVESSTNGAAPSQSTSEDSEAQRGRLNPNAAKSSVRSSSQDPIKKQKISEKEAQSKRLFAKDPKKAAQSAKSKMGRQTQAAVPKKTVPKKAAPAASSKVKSEEYVHDSDEDIDMVETLSPEPPKKQSPKPSPPLASRPIKVPPAKAEPTKTGATSKLKIRKVMRKERKPAAQPNASPIIKDTKPAGKTVTKVENGNASKKPAADTTQKGAPMARSLSHKRSNSSPIKPSPLGSSPPTNASDIENDSAIKSSKSSSSSNSPLINQRRDHEATARKAPARTSAPVAENSDRGLKRKANELDSDIHNHNVNASLSSESRPTKRHMSSSASSTTSNTPDRTASHISMETIKNTRAWQRDWDIYNRMHIEINGMNHPPREKVERLHRMHDRLLERKRQLWEAASNKS